MREIKFRAWTGERMFEPYYFEASPDSPMPFKCYEDWRDLEDGRSISCEIMQYTGMKDKSKKEIFEGDIDKETGCIVTWVDHGWYLTRDKFAALYPEPKRIKVIGNIYQNPELLKQGK